MTRGARDTFLAALGRGEAGARTPDATTSDCTPHARTSPEWRLALFARMWAVAALFHLLGNARDALTTSPQLAVASALLGATGAAVLLAPHRLWSLALLCTLVPVTAYYEAPVVGNHWVLASLISMALLVSALVTISAADRGRMWDAFSPAARLTFLVAYGFAAFAKLNSDFLDPSVSCALAFHNRLVSSWGLDDFTLSETSLFSHLVPVSAVVLELTVAVSLAVPRTRRLGLVLAACFHWLLAMDLDQHFWDFSAVLFALFMLFLDDAQVQRLRSWCSAVRSRSDVRRSLQRLIVVATGAVVVALNVLPTSADGLRVLLGHLGWWTYGTAVALSLVVLASAPKDRGAQRTMPSRPPVAVLWLLPVLAVLNGLTPYFEVKTGFSWNMYSNLRTVAGDTNHLLVPGTRDLVGAQEDQVRIVSASDPALAALGSSGYALPYRAFQEYAQDHPDVSVVYERDGQVRSAQRLADDPAGRGAGSALRERLLPFRSIDLSGTERCRPDFQLGR